MTDGRHTLDNIALSASGFPTGQTTKQAILDYYSGKDPGSLLVAISNEISNPTPNYDTAVYELKYWIFVLFFFKALDLWIIKYKDTEFISSSRQEKYKLEISDNYHPYVFAANSNAVCRFYFVNAVGNHIAGEVFSSFGFSNIDLHDLASTTVRLFMSSMTNSKMQMIKFKEFNKATVEKAL